MFAKFDHNWQSYSMKATLHQIPIEKLKRGKYQPRVHFDPDQLNELAESIKTTNGLLQPLVVRPLDDQFYEIIAGERRWRASQIAGFDTVMCLVNKYSDEQAIQASIIENINRADLNPIEEAKAYQRLMNEFSYIHEEIAATVGKSRAKVTNSLRLLKLEDRTQQLLITRQLSEGHGKVIAGVDPRLQFELANKCIKQNWSVRKIEQEAKKLQDKPMSTKQNKDPNLSSLESALSDHVGCKVNIGFDGQKGKLEIDFHNLEILEGLFEKMGFEKS